MTTTNTELTVRLRFDWGAGPFWVSAEDGGFDDYSPDDIGEVLSLSDDLLAATEDWYQRMQSTYDDRAPQDMGMRDSEEEASWVARGRQLARKVKREVGPEVQVEYSPLGGPVKVMECASELRA